MHKTDKVLSVCSATQTCKKQSWNNFSLYLHVYLFVCMSMCFTAYDTYKHDNINVAETLTAAFYTQAWCGNLKPWNFTSHHCYVLWFCYPILLTSAPYVQIVITSIHSIFLYKYVLYISVITKIEFQNFTANVCFYAIAVYMTVKQETRGLKSSCLKNNLTKQDE